MNILQCSLMNNLRSLNQNTQVYELIGFKQQIEWETSEIEYIFVFILLLSWLSIFFDRTKTNYRLHSQVYELIGLNNELSEKQAKLIIIRFYRCIVERGN